MDLLVFSSLSFCGPASDLTTFMCVVQVTVDSIDDVAAIVLAGF